MALVRPSRSPERPKVEAPVSIGRYVALGVFAVMAVAAPLLFGAVDPLPQIGLLALLVIGILAQPPVVVPPSPWGRRLALAFVALVLFKEFAPAALFGHTFWRTTLVGDYGLELPFTHNPEPARALDMLLSGAVAVVWFLWVRRLAGERSNRALLAWTLFTAAAVVAIVSFATRQPTGTAIYGVRFTPGWKGFGPFPNRNHSATFFAMGAVLGCGCLTWAALRKKWFLFSGGLALLGLNVIAMLATESRGGLIAFAIGLIAYLGLCLLKVRSRRALGAAVGAALFFGAIMLAFGAQVFSRFHSREAGEVSTDTRVGVWHDTIGMWQDAPIFGHGLGSFAQVFPLYQKIQLENQMALHPESSWLQWLVELGALPVLLMVVMAAIFLSSHLRASFQRHRSFFLYAGGFAVLAVLLGHALFDVPAHRWGTAGFALAALALATPLRPGGRSARDARLLALIPLGVALFWAAPFFGNFPAWSPISLLRLTSRDLIPGEVPMEQVQSELRAYPLNPDLHQSLGKRELATDGKASPAGWQREFAIASRLVPSSWFLSLAQARSVQKVSIMLSLKYWQQAIERGGMHRGEVLRLAVEETARSPLAKSSWGAYVEAHPNLLLTYAQIVPEEQGRYYFGRWWKQRAQATDLSPEEVQDFYQVAAHWGHREELEEWMTRHADWKERDFRQWAALLHSWGENVAAWQLLSSHVPEPVYPAKLPNIPREHLESTWRTTPQNLVNAQLLALTLQQAGENPASEEILLTVAAQPQAPPWFLEKAAYIMSRRNRLDEAVALMLRLRG